MQRPTCTNVRIRSTQDAHTIFYAIQRGLLHMVTRRLDGDERLALGTGCVYAWEERGPHTEITGLGIERFTEGRRWSPSRVRDEFLFYYEKYSPPPDSNQSGPERQPPRDWDPLVKQTYSVWVETDKGRRKWHLTAYFTQATVDRLGTIDDIEGVRDLVVPDGLFKSTRVGKNRGKTEEPSTGRLHDAPKAQTSVPRTYAAFPSPYPSSSQTSSPSGSQAVPLYEPYQNTSYFPPADDPPPQFSTTPPFSPSQRVLPAVRELHQPNSEHHNRSMPSPSHTYPEYGQVDPRPHRQIDPAYNNARTMTSYATSVSNGPELRYDQPNSDYTPAALRQSMPPQPWYPASTHDFPKLPPGISNNAEQPTAFAPRLPYTAAESTLPRSRSPPPLPPPDSSYPRAPPPYPQRSHNQREYPRGGSSPTQHPSGIRSTPSITAHLPIPPIAPPRAQARDRRPSPIDMRPALPTITIPETLPNSYELTPGSESHTPEGRRGSIGPCRDLAPLVALTRSHPYRRDPLDDKALRLLHPRTS